MEWNKQPIDWMNQKVPVGTSSGNQICLKALENIQFRQKSELDSTRKF